MTSLQSPFTPQTFGSKSRSLFPIGKFNLPLVAGEHSVYKSQQMLKKIDEEVMVSKEGFMQRSRTTLEKVVNRKKGVE
ncbi:hypothetical protein B9Z19DRAFT_1130017 [Tuber borchii]|uniref:Uncharacterized protein n=1 Tax=Tuber borchii TaxID=42251 RepID=A0A2T6ZL74_TUBBO|nr:hypothetical protein B9Z19DRAFT_1130017 [Tuber borchii]